MKKLYQMKNLKLLNKKYLSAILFYLLCGFPVQSQEPIDIWNIEKKNPIENTDTIDNNEEEKISQKSIYEMQSQKNDEPKIEEDQKLVSKKLRLWDCMTLQKMD